MTKRVFIIHGWDHNPSCHWYPWLKKELEEKDFEVFVPEMPNTEEPKINEWVSFLKEQVGELTEQTYFIGHSVGCQGVLRYLEILDSNVKVGGVVLIAPWMYLDSKTIEEEGEEIVEIAKPWMETPIDWDKIRIHTNKFICLLSDNDPYVPLSNKELFEEKLFAKIIIEHNKGHYAPDNNISENPTAFQELLKLSTSF